MTKTLAVSVADMVYDKISRMVDERKIKNKSQFVEEILRLGLAQMEKEEASA